MISVRFLKPVISVVLIFIAVVVNHAALAQTRVVVVPMAGDDLKPLQNIITIAKANGDFDSPIDALASITDASATNPYLLVIAPGVYDLASQLVMKEYVEITGSGRQATILRGSASSDSSSSSDAALVVGANNASLSSLKIENINGTKDFSVGLFCNQLTTLDLFNLSIFLSGGQSQTGLELLSSSLSLSNSRVSLASGGGSNIGVSFIAASGSLRNVSIDVKDGGFQQGVQVANQSSIDITDSTIIVKDGSSPYQGVVVSNQSSAYINSSQIQITGNAATTNGVLITAASSVVLTGSRVTVTGTFAPIGVDVNDVDSFVKIRDSDILGSVRSLRANTGSGTSETHVSNSTLDGPIDGDPVCSFVHNGAGVLLNGSCDAPPM